MPFFIIIYQSLLDLHLFEYEISHRLFGQHRS